MKSHSPNVKMKDKEVKFEPGIGYTLTFTGSERIKIRDKEKVFWQFKVSVIGGSYDVENGKDLTWTIADSTNPHSLLSKCGLGSNSGLKLHIVVEDSGLHRRYRILESEDSGGMLC